MNKVNNRFHQIHSSINRNLLLFKQSHQIRSNKYQRNRNLPMSNHSSHLLSSQIKINLVLMYMNNLNNLFLLIHSNINNHSNSLIRQSRQISNDNRNLPLYNKFSQVNNKYYQNLNPQITNQDNRQSKITIKIRLNLIFTYNPSCNFHKSQYQLILFQLKLSNSNFCNYKNPLHHSLHYKMQNHDHH